MKTNLLQQESGNMELAKQDIVNLIKDYFYAGNFEHQIGLISNAIQEVVNKGADDTDASIDNCFGYTNRYIRESVNDLTELQKFLTRLHIVYSDYKHKNEMTLWSELQ